MDEEGNVFKSIPISDELAEIIEEQKRKFVEKHGREPGPDENLFFDMPPLEHVEHFMVQGMQQAGIDPAIIYAFEKTGLLVTEANEHLISDKDRAEWEAAVLEYRAKQGDDEPEEDEENRVVLIVAGSTPTIVKAAARSAPGRGRATVSPDSRPSR